MSWLNLEAIPLLARICLVVLFPFSALDKIVHWNAALKQANSSFIPGGAMLLVIAIGIELVTPVCIVIGWHGSPDEATTPVIKDTNRELLFKRRNDIGATARRDGDAPDC